MTAIAATMQAFFTERLIGQRRASPHTIAAYRDTLRLLLGFAAQRTGTPPCRLDIADLDAPVISAFLDHLEHERGNSIRTRNARLAAIHSLFGYAALRHPEHAADIATGPGHPAQARRPDDRHLPHRPRGRGPARRPGPGHPHRPPRPRLDPARDPDRAAGLRAHRPDLPRCPPRRRRLRRLPRQRPQRPDHAADPRHRRHPARLARRTRRDTRRPAVHHHPRRADEPRRPATAAHPLRHRSRTSCPSLASKNVTPHVLRHSAAMALLHAGIDITVIALWLGHESVTTTQIYLQADMALKQQALDRTTPPAARPAATSRPTSSWPSSKPCDYADIASPGHPRRQHRPPGIGITTVSG